MELLFVISVLLVFYAYFGYPLLLAAGALVRSRDVRKGNDTPPVTLIIAAFNEASGIRNRIENALAQDYPADRYEIIVASDCSDDGTDDIVLEYAAQGVRLVRSPERKGKENAQKHAIEQASGEILVFSDVATGMDRDGISRIVRNFADPSVGCVSSVDRFINPDGSISGEGAYVRYEMFLRSLEGRVNSVVGLSGSFFAARKKLCSVWATDLPSDFNTLMNSIKSGYRGISDPESVGYYHNIANEKKEYGRKVRTVVRGITAFMRNLDLLNPFRYGLFAWQLFSHKLCRWLVPFAMIGAGFSTIHLALGGSSFFGAVLLAQVVFYGLAGVGLLSGSARSLLKIPAFFVLVNISILHAWGLSCTGRTIVTWTPSERRVHGDTTVR